MHPLTTPDQSIQYVADRTSRLRSEASAWRRARQSTRLTRSTPRRAA